MGYRPRFQSLNGAGLELQGVVLGKATRDRLQCIAQATNNKFLNGATHDCVLLRGPRSGVKCQDDPPAVQEIINLERTCTSLVEDMANFKASRYVIHHFFQLKE